MKIDEKGSKPPGGTPTLAKNSLRKFLNEKYNCVSWVTLEEFYYFAPTFRQPEITQHDVLETMGCGTFTAKISGG